MIRALGRIRTDRALFESGDEISGLPLFEEERLIALGVAERLEEEPEVMDEEPLQEVEEAVSAVPETEGISEPERTPAPEVEPKGGRRRKKVK